jgi:hypothetical protein
MNLTNSVALYIFRATEGGKRIATARDTVLYSYPVRSLRWWLEEMAARSRILVDPDVPADPVQARIECGRWLASCPACGGYIDVDPAEPVWLCVTCGGMKLRSGVSQVLFPENREEIENILLERARIVDRNWLPGETAADLRAQNLILAEA